MPTHSSLSRNLRLVFILAGVSIIVWLTIENHSELLVLVFATIFSTLFAVQIVHRAGFARISIYLWVVIGGLTGLAIPLMVILLMLLKNGLHSNLVPDFTLAQVVSLLQRAPYFLAGGLLIGLGMGLLRDFRRGPP
jgi:hypothetical protein